MSICGSCPIYWREDGSECNFVCGQEDCMEALQNKIRELTPSDSSISFEAAVKQYPELKEFPDLYPFGKIGRKQVTDGEYDLAFKLTDIHLITTDWYRIEFYIRNGILVFAIRGQGKLLRNFDQTIIIRRPPDNGN